MKIIRIIARLNVGGPARHVVALAEGLNDDEFQTVLVAGRVPEGEEDMSYIAEAAGVRPVYIEQMSRELSSMDLVALWRLFLLMRRERPTIVHTHTAKAGTIGRLAALLFKWLTPASLIGKPRRVLVFHTFHGHVFHSYYGKSKTRFFLLIERLLARCATDKIIVLSPQLLAEINEDHRIGKPEQFDIVPLGIDMTPYLAGGSPGLARREAAAVPGRELKIGFVGRLTDVKNVSMYIRAAAAYEERAGGTIPTARFVVAGDGALRADLEAEAESLGLDGVAFLGSIREVENVYAGLDIVALTSLNEGTPLSLIEGMAAGKPVIATLVGGVPDLLGDRTASEDGFAVFERGVGCKSGDVEGFTKGLIYLAKSEKLRKELGGRGRKFAVANFGKERLVRDIRSLYQKEASRFEGDR
ncbi:MAG TPA: glycosyltransferase [Pyrinomonadaceae bacterium]|nr:glycosyltransferase [Pyrinomonadaceae bacterium]